MLRYAPGFAKSVVREGDGWLLESARGPLRLTPAINADLGTVDFHLTAVNGTPSAVFTRALPNGSGTEFVFTLFLQSTAPDSAVAEQSDILSQELQLLKELCESPGAARTSHAGTPQFQPQVKVQAAKGQQTGRGLAILPRTGRHSAADQRCWTTPRHWFDPRVIPAPSQTPLALGQS
jgi:hypothetical protein